MSKAAIYVSNLSNSLRPTPGAAALAAAISSVTVVAKLDASLAEKPTGGLEEATERLVCQVLSGDVWMSLHNAATPGVSNAIRIPAGMIFILSRSEWLNSTWLRVSDDATLTGQQMGAN